MGGGGYSWTPDFVCQVENLLDPLYPYTLFDGCPKGLKWFLCRTCNFLSQIVSFLHLQIWICDSQLSVLANPLQGQILAGILLRILHRGDPAIQ
jgi:hypothetical protein